MVMTMPVVVGLSSLHIRYVTCVKELIHVLEEKLINTDGDDELPLYWPLHTQVLAQPDRGENEE